MNNNQYDDYEDPYVEDVGFDNLDDLYDDEISNDLVVQDEEFEYLNLKRNNRKRLFIWLGITLGIIALLIIIAGTTLGIIKNKANKPSDNKDSFKYLESSDLNHAKLSDTTFEYIPDEHEVLNGRDLAKLLRIRADKKLEVDKLATYLYSNSNGKETYVRKQRISKEDLLEQEKDYRLKVVYRLKEKDSKTQKEIYRWYKYDFRLKLNYKNVIFFYSGNNTYLDGVNRKKYQQFILKGEDNRKRGNAEGSYYEFLYQKGVDPYLDSEKLIPKDEFKTAYKSIDRLSTDVYKFTEIAKASSVYLPDVTSKNRNVLLKFQIRTITNDGKLGPVLKTIEKWVTDGEKDSITSEIIQRLQNEFTLPTSEYEINGKKFDADGNRISRDGLYEINPSIWYSKIETGKDLDNPTGHQIDLYDLSLSNFTQNNIGVERKIKKAEGEDFIYREVVLEQYVKQINAYMSYEMPNVADQPAPTKVQTGDLVGVPFDPENEVNNKDYKLVPKDKYLNYWMVKEDGTKLYKDTSLNIGSPYKITKDFTLRAELEDYKVIKLALPSSKYPFDSSINPDWEINQVIRLRKDQEVYGNIINHVQTKIRNLEQFTEAENPLNADEFKKLIATNIERTNFFQDENIKAGDPSVKDEYYLRFPKVGILLKETVDGTTLSEPRHYLVLANNQSGLETSLIKRPNTFITPASIADLRDKVIPYQGAITLDVKYESYKVSILLVKKHDQVGGNEIVATNISGIKLGQKLEKNTIKQILNKAKGLAPINNWSEFAGLNTDSSLQDSTKLLEDSEFIPDEQHDKNFDAQTKTYKIYVKYSAGYGKLNIEPEYTKKEDNKTYVKDTTLKKVIDLKFSEKGNINWDDVKENPTVREILKQGFIVEPVNLAELKGKFDNSNKNITFKPRFKRESYTLTFNKKNETNDVVSKTFYFEEVITRVKLESVINSGASYLEFDYFMYFNQGISQHFDFEGVVAPNKNISDFIVSRNTTFDVIFREKKARVKIIAVETSSENNLFKPNYSFDDAIKGVEGLKLIKDEFMQKLGKLSYTFPKDLVPSGFELDSEEKEINLLKENEKYVIQFNLKRKKMTLKFLKWDNSTSFKEVEAFYGKKISSFDDLADIPGSVFLGWAFKENNKRFLPGYVLDFYKEVVEIIPIKGEEKGTIKTWYFTTNPKTNTFQSDVLGLDFNNLYQKYKEQLYLAEEKQIKTGLEYKYNKDFYEDSTLKEIMEVYQGFTFEGLSADYVLKNEKADQGVVAGRKNEVKNIVYFLKRKEVNLHFKRLDATDFLPNIKLIKKWFGYNDLDMKELIPEERYLDYEKISGYKLTDSNNAVSEDNLIDAKITKEYLFSQEFWENEKGLVFTKTKYMYLKLEKVDTVKVNFISDDTVYREIILKKENPTLEHVKELFYSSKESAENNKIPQKNGYIFMGWYYDKNFTKLVNPYDSFTYNTTFYARWVLASDFVENYIGSDILDYYSQSGNQAISGYTSKDLELKNPNLWGVDSGNVYYPNLTNLGFDIFENTAYKGKFEESEKNLILNTIWPFNDSVRNKIENVFAPSSYKYLYRSFNNLRNLLNVYFLDLGEDGKTILTSFEVPNGDGFGNAGSKIAPLFNNVVLKKILFSKRLDVVYFRNLYKLEEITLSIFAHNKLKQEAFMNNYNLTNVNFTDLEMNNGTFPKRIFKNAYSLKELTLPKFTKYGDLEIDEEAFMNALLLRSVKYHPNSDKTKKTIIRKSAFLNCEKLVNLDFISNVKEFRENSMENTKSFKEIKSNTVSKVEFLDEAFKNSGITEIFYQKTMEDILVKRHAFKGSMLKKFEYSGKISMHSGAFNGATKLINIGHSNVLDNIKLYSDDYGNYGGYFEETDLKRIVVDKFDEGMDELFFYNLPSDCKITLRTKESLLVKSGRISKITKWYLNPSLERLEIMYRERIDNLYYLDVSYRKKGDSYDSATYRVISVNSSFTVKNGNIYSWEYVTKILSVVVNSNDSLFDFAKLTAFRYIGNIFDGRDTKLSSVITGAFIVPKNVATISLVGKDISDREKAYYPHAFQLSSDINLKLGKPNFNAPGDFSQIQDEIFSVVNYETTSDGNKFYDIFVTGEYTSDDNRYMRYAWSSNKKAIFSLQDNPQLVDMGLYEYKYIIRSFASKEYIYHTQNLNFEFKDFDNSYVRANGYYPYKKIIDGVNDKSTVKELSYYSNYITNMFFSADASKFYDTSISNIKDSSMHLYNNHYPNNPNVWYAFAFYVDKSKNSSPDIGSRYINHALLQKYKTVMIYDIYNSSLNNSQSLTIKNSSQFIKNFDTVIKYAKNTNNNEYFKGSNFDFKTNPDGIVKFLRKIFPLFSNTRYESLNYIRNNDVLDLDYKLSDDSAYNDNLITDYYLQHDIVHSNIGIEDYPYASKYVLNSPSNKLILRNMGYKERGIGFGKSSYYNLVFDSLHKDINYDWYFKELREVEFNNSIYQVGFGKTFDISNLLRVKSSVPHRLNDNDFPKLKLVESDIKNFNGANRNVPYLEALKFWAQKDVSYLIKNTSISSIDKVKELFNNLISKSNDAKNYFETMYPTEEDKNELYQRYILNPEKDTVVDGIRYVVKNGQAIAIDYERDKKSTFPNRTVYNIPENIQISGVNYPVVKVAPRLFYGHNTVEKVYFGNNISDYPTSALFKDNLKLKDVVFGKGYTKLSENEFDGCGSVENLNFANRNINLEHLDSIKKNLKLNEIKFRLSGKYNTYVNVDNSLVNLRTRQLILGSAKSKIPKNVKEITEYAFNKSDIKKLNLPNSVERISQFAFNKSSLSKIYLGTGIKEIESFAFKDCSNLREIWLPKGVKHIGAYAFEGCTNLVVNYEGDSIPLSWDSEWSKGITSLTLKLKQANPGPIS